MNRFDVVLQRITSISQIVLVIIAIFTIWYSVIPLYQKELASEQLAKIQIDQIAAEDRLEFLNASHAQQLIEIESTRKEISQLTAKLTDDRSYLGSLKAEIEKKDRVLSTINASLDSAKSQTRAAQLQVVNSQRLRFIQALEWYTLTAPLDEKCDKAMSRWARSDTPRTNVNRPGCNPYNNIKAAVLKIQIPKAVDSSGDPLNIDSGNLKVWCERVISLLEKNKYQLVDQMNYSHRDQLLAAAEKGVDSDHMAPQEREKSIVSQLEASKALVDYEYEIKSKNSEVVSWFISLLRADAL